MPQCIKGRNRIAPSVNSIAPSGYNTFWVGSCHGLPYSGLLNSVAKSRYIIPASSCTHNLGFDAVLMLQFCLALGH